MSSKFNSFISTYFLTATSIVKNDQDNILTFQFFQRNDNVVFCGGKESLRILNSEIKNKFKAWSIPDGTIINNLEPVFILEGKASDILRFEGILDGIFSRLSSIATNAFNTIKASNKPIIMMADRSDLYINQNLDGYAAYVGGIKIFCSSAQEKYLNCNDISESFGSIPHSLIVNYNGDLEKALLAYKKQFPSSKIISLVDFNNDVITDSLLSAKILGKNLYGVRVDTAINLIDKSLQKLPKSEKLYGANPTLIKLLRKELDSHGYKYVKIIVSSGFTPERIKYFINEKTPIDFFGVGCYLTNISVKFTGDAVKVNGKNVAKFGREYLKNSKLIEIK